MTEAMTGTVFVVEDEPAIQSLVSDYLRQSGFAVETCGDGKEALGIIEARAQSGASFDLIVLDVMLPGLDGLEVCQRVRQFSMVPVVFLTARHDEIDRLLGLRLGADDYISKPFSPRELVARVEAILRRTRHTHTAPSDQAETSLQLDKGGYQATLHGQALDLTPVEFRLLECLSTKPGRVFRRDQLVQAAYEDYRIVSDRTIDSHIKNLRIKLHQAAPHLQLIHSVYGVGYRYEAVADETTP